MPITNFKKMPVDFQYQPIFNSIICESFPLLSLDIAAKKILVEIFNCCDVKTSSIRTLSPWWKCQFKIGVH